MRRAVIFVIVVVLVVVMSSTVTANFPPVPSVGQAFSLSNVYQAKQEKGKLLRYD